MPKLKLKSKLKPKLRKQSEWEILPDDVPMAQNGGNTGYQWSNQETPSNYTLATPKDVNVSRTESNRQLTPKEIEQLKKYTAEQNQLKKEQEYNQRQQGIQQSIQAQNQPLTIDNLRTRTQATGDKLSFAMNTRFGNPKEYPTLSGYMDALDFINPGKFIGDMAPGLGALPYNVREGNYGQAAFAVAAPLVTGALAGIGTQSTKQFVNNLTNPVPDFGKYLTTKTPLKNTFKINPFSSKLGQYNRVVGEDAIQDIINTGLVRSNPEAGVKTTIGALRQTPFPSFAKGSPRQTYINQTVDQGHVPYIISTDRPMAVSTLGRHGKGSTMFPVDDNYVPELKNYLSGFSANEAKVFEANPHWLKGYKPVNTSTPNFKSGGKIKTDPQGYWNKDNHGKPVRIPSNRITMKGVNQPLMGISDTGDIQMMFPGMDYSFDGNSVTEFPVKAQDGRVITKREDFEGNFLSPIANYFAGKEKLDRDIRKNQYGAMYDLYRYYFGLPPESNILTKSKYRPTISKNINDEYISINDSIFKEQVLDIAKELKPNETKQVSGYEGKYIIDKNIFDSFLGKVSPKLKKEAEEKRNKTNAIGRFIVSKSEDEGGNYVSYYDIFDKQSGNKTEFMLGTAKPFEIYDRIYYDPKTNKIVSPKKPYIQKAPLPGQSVAIPPEFKEGGKINNTDWEIIFD